MQVKVWGSLVCIVTSLLITAGLASAANDEQRADVKVSVSIAPVAKLEFDGERRLQFSIDSTDIARGYKQLQTSSDLRWATNLPGWSITVRREAWAGPGHFTAEGLRLELAASNITGDLQAMNPPTTQTWFTVGELPADWLSGTDGMQGAAHDLQWRAVGFVPTMPAGIYTTTVFFNISAD
jgi:hypothetical protein